VASGAFSRQCQQKVSLLRPEGKKKKDVLTYFPEKGGGPKRLRCWRTVGRISQKGGYAPFTFAGKGTGGQAIQTWRREKESSDQELRRFGRNKSGRKNLILFCAEGRQARQIVFQGKKRGRRNKGSIDAWSDVGGGEVFTSLRVQKRKDIGFSGLHTITRSGGKGFVLRLRKGERGGQCGWI